MNLHTKLLALSLSLLLLFSTIGCGQSQLAALAKIVSTSLSTLATIDPANAGAYSKASGIMDAVSVDITNWKAGQPSTEIVQGVTDAVSILEAVVNLTPQEQALIGLAEVTMEEIINLVQPAGSSAQVSAKMKANVTLPAPKTAAEYKARWNSQCPPNARLK